MFYCENCKELSKPNEKSVMVPVETRTKKYRTELVKDKKVHIIESEGTEIVREVRMCADCADQVK